MNKWNEIGNRLEITTWHNQNSRLHSMKACSHIWLVYSIVRTKRRLVVS